jgi:hypothetical protein
MGTAVTAQSKMPAGRSEAADTRLWARGQPCCISHGDGYLPCGTAREKSVKVFPS